MSKNDESEGAPAGQPGATGNRSEGSDLSRVVREHLGQQLRATYNEISDKPEYLGDPVIPPFFGAQIRRLETREKAHETGIAAVESALTGLETALAREDNPSPDVIDGKKADGI